MIDIELNRIIANFYLTKSLYMRNIVNIIILWYNLTIDIGVRRYKFI